LEEGDGAGQGEEGDDAPPARLDDQPLDQRAAPAAPLGPVDDGQRAYFGQGGRVEVERAASDDVAHLILGDEPVGQSVADGVGRARQEIAAASMVVNEGEDAGNVFRAGRADVQLLIPGLEWIAKRGGTMYPPL